MEDFPRRFHIETITESIAHDRKLKNFSSVSKIQVLLYCVDIIAVAHRHFEKFVNWKFGRFLRLRHVEAIIGGCAGRIVESAPCLAEGAVVHGEVEFKDFLGVYVEAVVDVVGELQVAQGLQADCLKSKGFIQNVSSTIKK